MIKLHLDEVCNTTSRYSMTSIDENYNRSMHDFSKKVNRRRISYYININTTPGFTNNHKFNRRKDFNIIASRCRQIFNCRNPLRKGKYKYGEFI